MLRRVDPPTSIGGGRSAAVPSLRQMAAKRQAVSTLSRNVHVAVVGRAQAASWSMTSRQRASLRSILNRWVQLMENGSDASPAMSEVVTLADHAFSQVVLNDLLDEAYLRRIFTRSVACRRQVLTISRRVAAALASPS
jgi:hypothetical protein